MADTNPKNRPTQSKESDKDDKIVGVAEDIGDAVAGYSGGGFVGGVLIGVLASLVGHGVSFVVQFFRRHPKIGVPVTVALIAAVGLWIFGQVQASNEVKRLEQASIVATRTAREADPTFIAAQEQRLIEEATKTARSDELAAMENDPGFAETRATTLGVETGVINLMAAPLPLPVAGTPSAGPRIAIERVQSIDLDETTDPPVTAFDLVVNNSHAEPHLVRVDVGFTVEVREPGDDAFRERRVARELEFVVPAIFPGGTVGDSPIVPLDDDSVLPVIDGGRARLEWRPVAGANVRIPGALSAEITAVDTVPTRDPRDVLRMFDVELILADPPVYGRGRWASALRCFIAITNGDRSPHTVELSGLFETVRSWSGEGAEWAPVSLETTIAPGVTAIGLDDGEPTMAEFDVAGDELRSVYLTDLTLQLRDGWAIAAGQPANELEIMPVPTGCNFGDAPPA